MFNYNIYFLQRTDGLQKYFPGAAGRRITLCCRGLNGSFTEAPGGSVCLLAPLGGALRFAAAGWAHVLQRRRGVAEASEVHGGRAGVSP